MCYYYAPVSCGHRDRTLRVVYIFCVLLLCACQLWTKGQDLEGCIYILCVTIMCLSVVDIGTGLGWVCIDFVCHQYLPLVCGHKDRTLRVVYIFYVLLLCACKLWT